MSKPIIMLIKFEDNDPKRQETIKRVLPSVPFTESIVLPALWQLMLQPLLQALKAEIEVYRAYPKRGKFDLKAFNPRNNKTCFMGLGFKSNDNWTDAELRDYRKAVGTYSHKVWGDGVTLLEIWGGDHFEKYPEMVKAVFDYAYGGRNTMPKVTINIMPLIITKDTGTRILDEQQQAEVRIAILAQENEMRRQYGLPPSDWLAEEIEEMRKAGTWDEEHRCPKDQVPPRPRSGTSLNEEEDEEGF